MKKKFLALLSVLCLIATAAYATTTHYSFILPVVGGSQNTWGTIANTAFSSIDTQLWTNAGGVTIALNAPASSAANITLTNPVANTQNISFSTTGKKLILPAMNASTSMVPGGILWVKNVGSNAFDVDANDGSTALASGLTAGQIVGIQLLTGSTANGTFNVSGPYLTSVSGSVNLGASTSATNPSISGDLTSGFYTAGAAEVDVAISGTNRAKFTSTGVNATAIGATTSSTGVFTTMTAGTVTTPSAAITGGTINGTTIGASTPSTAIFSTTTETTDNIGIANTTTENVTNLNVNGNALTYAAPTSWTPVLKFGGGTSGVTYGTQTGSYTKIGKLVLAEFEITLTSKGVSTGGATITGLPFTTNITGYCAISYYGNVGGNFASTNTNGSISAGTSVITLQYNAGSGVGALTNADFTDTSTIEGSAIYISP